MSESRLLEANKPNVEFKVFQPRLKDVLYEVIPLEDKFLVVRNKSAPNFKVVEIPLNKTSV